MYLVSMEQSLSRPGSESGWSVLGVVVAIGLVAVVYVTTDAGALVAVLGVLGLVFLYGGVRSGWQAIASQSVAREDVGSLAGTTGAVEIEGTASPVGDAVRAPITDSESVAYTVEVAEWEPPTE